VNVNRKGAGSSIIDCGDFAKKKSADGMRQGVSLASDHYSPPSANDSQIHPDTLWRQKIQIRQTLQRDYYEKLQTCLSCSYEAFFLSQTKSFNKFLTTPGLSPNKQQQITSTAS
jgi:hypothetical protein